MVNDKEKIFFVLKEELPYLQKEYGVKRIGVFGSLIKGKMKKGSDIDLVIEFFKPIGLRFIELADHLESLLKVKVDLLTETGVSNIRNSRIKNEIRSTIEYV